MQNTSVSKPVKELPNPLVDKPDNPVIDPTASISKEEHSCVLTDRSEKKLTSCEDSDPEFNPDYPHARNPPKKRMKIPLTSHSESPQEKPVFSLDNWDKLVPKIRKSVRVPKFKKISQDFITWTENDPSRLLKRSSSNKESSVSRPIEHFTKSLNLIATSADVINKYGSSSDGLVIPEEKEDPFIPAPSDSTLETLNNDDVLTTEPKSPQKIMYPMFVPRKKKKYFMTDRKLPEYSAADSSEQTIEPPSVEKIAPDLVSVSPRKEKEQRVSKLDQNEARESWSSLLVSNNTNNDGPPVMKLTLKRSLSSTNNNQVSKKMKKTKTSDGPSNTMSSSANCMMPKNSHEAVVTCSSTSLEAQEEETAVSSSNLAEEFSNESDMEYSRPNVTVTRRSSRTPKAKCIDENFIIYSKQYQNVVISRNQNIINKSSDLLESKEADQVDSPNEALQKSSTLSAQSSSHKKKSEGSPVTRSQQKINLRGFVASDTATSQLSNDVEKNVLPEEQNATPAGSLKEKETRGRKRKAPFSPEITKKIKLDSLQKNLSNDAVQKTEPMKTRHSSRASEAKIPRNTVEDTIDCSSDGSQNSCSEGISPTTDESNKQFISPSRPSRSLIRNPSPRPGQVTVESPSSSTDNRQQEPQNRADLVNACSIPTTMLLPESSGPGFGTGGCFVWRDGKLVKVDSSIKPKLETVSGFPQKSPIKTSTLMRCASSGPHSSSMASADKVSLPISQFPEKKDRLLDSRLTQDNEVISNDTECVQQKMPVFVGKTVLHDGDDELSESSRSSLEEGFFDSGSPPHFDLHSDKSQFWFDMQKVVKEQKALVKDLTKSGYYIGNPPIKDEFLSSDNSEDHGNNGQASGSLRNSKEKTKSYKVLRCNQCSFSTRGKSFFAIHLSEHAKMAPSKNFEVIDEDASDDDGNDYKCHKCHYTTTTKSALSYHLRRHKSSSVHSCKHCNKSFASRNHLRIHLATFHEGDVNHVETDTSPENSGENDIKSSNPSTSVVPKESSSRDKSRSPLKSDHRRKKKSYPTLYCPYCDFRTRAVLIYSTHVKTHQVFGDRPVEVIADQSEDSSSSKKSDNIEVNTTDNECSPPSSQADSKSSSSHSDSNQLPEAHDMSDANSQEDDVSATENSNEDQNLNDKEFSCDKCSFVTSRKRSFTWHMKKHVNSESGSSVPCVFCSSSFSSKNKLAKHISVEHRQDTYSCHTCDTQFPRVSEFVDHLSLHSKKNLIKKCLYCPFKTVHNISFKHHMARHTGQNVYKCPFCKYKTPSMKNYREHVSNHAGLGYTCQICSYKTSYEVGFKRHMAKEHNHSSYISCKYDGCGYQTYRKDLLKDHIRSIHQLKKYKCKSCDYVGSTLYQLRVHNGKKHLTGLMECLYCDYRTACSGNMKSHIIRHTGQDIVYCPYCSYSSDRKSYLKHHISSKHSELLS